MDIKTEIEFNRNTRMTDVYTESSSEHVLPDYNGDVRKILYTSAEARPAGKFASSDELELSGIVAYDVIYLDSENNISSASFSSEYDYKVKCSGEKYKDAYNDTRVASYSIRLNGPRKIVAKATVVGSVKLCEEDVITVGGDAFDEKYLPEADRKPLSVRRMMISEELEREYAESLEKLEGAIADEVSVIYSGAEAYAESVEYVDSGAEISGRLRMMAVVKNGDASAYLSEKTVGFSERVSFDEDVSGMKLLPDVRVVSAKAVVNAEEGGCAVAMSVILELSVLAEGNRPVEVIKDGYSKVCQSSNNYTDFNYLELSDVLTSKEGHTAEVSRSELDSDGIREIVLLTAAARVENVEKTENEIKVMGEVRYSGIASEISDGDKASYVMLKFSSPFELTLMHSLDDWETLRLEMRVKAHSASASIDANKIYAGCTIDAECIAYNERCERILSESYALEDNKYENSDSKITVYYPSNDETLFEISKRYHASPAKIARDNSLDVGAMVGDSADTWSVKKLLIYSL